MFQLFLIAIIGVLGWTYKDEIKALVSRDTKISELEIEKMKERILDIEEEVILRKEDNDERKDGLS